MKEIRSIVFGVLAVTFSAGSSALCGAAMIGTVESTSSYFISGKGQTGRTSLSCNQVVESRSDLATVKVGSKGRFQMDPNSRAKFCEHSATIEKGSAQFLVPSGFSVQSGLYKLVPESKPFSRALITNQSGDLNVNVLSGHFRVLGPNQVKVAELAEGDTRRFRVVGAMGGNKQQVIGCLQRVEGGYKLRDENSNLTQFITGDHISEYEGQRIQLIGTEAESPKGPPTMRVLRSTVLSKRCVCEIPVETILNGIGVTAASGGVVTGTLLSRGINASPSVK